MNEPQTETVQGIEVSTVRKKPDNAGHYLVRQGYPRASAQALALSCGLAAKNSRTEDFLEAIVPQISSRPIGRPLHT